MSAKDTGRRSFLRAGLSLGWGIGALGLGAVPFVGARSAERGRARRKLILLVVAGGWDSALATDPVTSAKRASGNYQSAYGTTFGIHAVDGKPDLLVGEGLVEAIPAFASLPTCFVNGVFMEVSAHEIALNYMLSGVPSLSRSREYPSIAALAGEGARIYPPHVVLGRAPPLGETRFRSPPLQSMSTGLLASMVQGPGSEWAKPATVKAGNDLVSELDSIAEAGLASAQRAALGPWRAASAGVEDVYARNLSTLLAYTDEVKERWLGAEDWQGPGTVAGAFLTLKAGLSPFVTVSFAGAFDTHSDHAGRHPGELQRLARTLAVLAEELAATPDPDDTTLTLADTTLVLVASEFVRTPKFNGAGGTDHWQSGSAILMGAGVVDGAVVGRTGVDAHALGWRGGDATARTPNTALLPEHLVAAVLRRLGFPSASKGISTSPLSGVLHA
jgi:uncharacterized protein (DUF1501 family)